MLPLAAVLLVLGLDTAAAAEAPPPPPLLALGGGSLYTSVFSSLHNTICQSERSSKARVRSRRLLLCPKGPPSLPFLVLGGGSLYTSVFEPARSTHAR